VCRSTGAVGAVHVTGTVPLPSATEVTGCRTPPDRSYGPAGIRIPMLPRPTADRHRQRTTCTSLDQPSTPNANGNSEENGVDAGSGIDDDSSTDDANTV